MDTAFDWRRDGRALEPNSSRYVIQMTERFRFTPYCSAALKLGCWRPMLGNPWTLHSVRTCWTKVAKRRG